MLLSVLFDTQRNDRLCLLLHKESNDLLLGNAVYIRCYRYLLVHSACGLLRSNPFPARRRLMQSTRCQFIRELLVLRRILCRRRNYVLLAADGTVLPGKLLPVLRGGHNRSTEP